MEGEGRREGGERMSEEGVERRGGERENVEGGG